MILFLAAPAAAVTKIVSRGYKKIVYSRKINRKCCQRFVKTAAKFQDNIFKIEKIWATEFIDINIPTKLATSLTRFTICLLIRIIYKINGLYHTVGMTLDVFTFLQEIVFLACGFLRLTLVFTVFQPLHFLFGNSYVLTLNIASLCA